MKDRFAAHRNVLKANWDLVTNTISDQQKGVPIPLQEAPPEPGDDVVHLPEIILHEPVTALGESQGRQGGAEASTVLARLLFNRKSRRKFAPGPVSLYEAAYILWACEGLRINKGHFSFRTVPSGGARHPLDVYIFAHNVEGLALGLYRYLPIEHALVLERAGDDAAALNTALAGQFWNAACVLLWAAVPYRSEWKYGLAAQKLIAIDVGHSCQNLYLACEALGLGTCAIGAYDQQALDRWLGLDGEDMFALLAAPVGRALPPAGTA